MDTGLVLIIISITIAAMALVALLWIARGKGNRSQTEAATMGEIMGLMKAMGEANASGHEQLRRTLEERLEMSSKRLGDGLNQHTEKTGEAMKQVHERLAVIDNAQAKLTDLSNQVVGLQDILSNKQARGAFGEVQLNNLVTDALPKDAYDFQETLSNGKRPDCILKLPNPPGSIVIDSKFPLESYRQLQAAGDEAAIKNARAKFSADVKKHIVAISEKYIIPGETAESALMFLPSEAVYAELHANFSNVVEESQRRRVYIVSPSTMMAMLNTVRAVLKDVHMREQADVIQIEVMKLLKDVQLLDQRTEKLETHFQQAKKDIKQIRTSTGKIIGRGEKIKELEVGDISPSDDLTPPLPASGRSANEP